MGAAKKTRCGMMPARVALALLSSAGVVMLYVLRINMSVTIVAMVRPIPARGASDADKDAGSTSLAAPKAYCVSVPEIDNTTATTEYKDLELLDFNVTQPDEGEADEWSDQLTLTSTQRGMVLGAFFYGYFATNIPGGRLAEEYGTKKVFGGSILISGLLTLLTPVAARVHYILLIALRVIIGLVNGVVYPALNVMVSRWIPPLERPRFMSFTYMSNTLGTIITLPLCAVIADTMGWPFVFYITGAASLVWVAMWGFLMHDFPETHPRISQEEKNYILNSIKKEKSEAKPTRTPWRSFLTSVPLWAITIGHTGSMFGFNLLLTQLPSYMDSILGFSITNNGLLSSLPFLSQFFGSTITGVLGDWLLTKGYISVHNSRRLFNVVSVLLPGILIVQVGYLGCNTALAVALLCLSSCFSGAMCSGQIANTHDLSPNFSGTIFGISNTIAYALSMCVPVIAGAMTTGQTLHEWQTVFWMTGAIQAITSLFFFFFSSADIQPWNYGEASDEEEGEKRKEDEVADVEKEQTEEKKLFLPPTDKPEKV